MAYFEESYRSLAAETYQVIDFVSFHEGRTWCCMVFSSGDVLRVWPYTFVRRPGEDELEELLDGL